MKINNSGKIYRSPKNGQSRYTPIANDVLQNTKLSLEARGLLSYLLSLPLDWVPVKVEVQKKNGLGRDKFDRIWKELVDAGYIESVQEKDDRGIFRGWKHQVWETPQVGLTDCGKNLHSDNPHSENPTGIKERDQENKDIIKERSNKKEIITKKEAAYRNSTVTADSFNKTFNSFF